MSTVTNLTRYGKGPRGFFTRHRLSFTSGRRLLLAILTLGVVLQLYLSSFVFLAHDKEQQQKETHHIIEQVQQERCAINFFGLPRAFENIVLPSLIKNVIIPNAHRNCDYFVHYYQLEREVGGRSGQGGKIDPEKIRLLEQEVLKHHPDNLPRPTIQFVVEEEADFWKQYQPLLDKIHNTKDEKGNPLYFPFNARTYKKETMDNIIKMWHSIQQVWKTMEQYARDENFEYKQVAMFRSDVLYMTPIRLYEYPDNVVVPGFGRYPVSDRIVYGPAAAVKVWATERFSRIDEHVRFMQKRKYGWGLHEERFMNFAIFPAMRKALQQREDAIVEHSSLCFFRARSDETVWVSDCDVNAKKSIMASLLRDGKTKRRAVEDVLGRMCRGDEVRIKYSVWEMDCHK